jgi:hypothetical protein
MSDKPISGLRRRMIADMTVRSFGDKRAASVAPHIPAGSFPESFRTTAR